jgi:multisubunit Na+/H+ antiporter MnhB subunit
MPERRQFPSESLFSARSKVYKLGLLGLLFSFILFIIGYSSPCWIRFELWREDDDDDDDDGHGKFINFSPNRDDVHRVFYFGLWNAKCFTPGSTCNTGIHVAQIACSFHLAGYIVSLAVAMYENCKRADPVAYFSRALEICLFITGILGTVGMAVYVMGYKMSMPHSTSEWSLTVASLSITGIYFTFFLIFFSNRRPVCTRGTVLFPPQQPGVIYYSSGNPCNATIIQNYQLSHSRNQPQSQPLLPPQHPQPYFYPPLSHHLDPPPAYSLPPAYPLPQQPPSYAYPTYHEYPQAGLVQASAPPYDGTMTQKN